FIQRSISTGRQVLTTMSPSWWSNAILMELMHPLDLSLWPEPEQVSSFRRMSKPDNSFHRRNVREVKVLRGRYLGISIALLAGIHKLSRTQRRKKMKLAKRRLGSSGVAITTVGFGA